MPSSSNRSVLGVRSPQGQKILGWLGVMFIGGIVGFGVWINVLNLQEAFGSGAPYFNQTTNMDKWSNPIPMLIILDMVILCVVFFSVKFIKQCFRH